MTGVGLSTRAMAGYAQSLNSLFGFVASRRSSRRVMLRDQFRSAPDVVRFLNDTFYGGKLRAARDPDTLKAPKGRRPGIAWTDVAGRVERDESGGPRNRAEADAVADHLDELLDRQGFDGTVGVVSPFNAQVALLTDAIAALMRDEPVFAYEFEGTRYDCGDKLGYLQATVEYGVKHPDFGEAFAEYLRQRAG